MKELDQVMALTDAGEPPDGWESVPPYSKCLWCGHVIGAHLDVPVRPCTGCTCAFLVSTDTLGLVCDTPGCGHTLAGHARDGCGAGRRCRCEDFTPPAALVAASAAAIAGLNPDRPLRNGSRVSSRDPSQKGPACEWCADPVEAHDASEPYTPCTRCSCRFLVHATTMQLACARSGCGHSMEQHQSTGCAMAIPDLPYCPCPRFEPDPVLVGLQPAPFLPARSTEVDGEPVLDAACWSASFDHGGDGNARIAPIPPHDFYDFRVQAALELGRGAYLVVSVARDKHSDWVVLQEHCGEPADQGETARWTEVGTPLAIPLSAMTAVMGELTRAMEAAEQLTGYEQPFNPQIWKDGPAVDLRALHDPTILRGKEIAPYLRTIDAPRMSPEEYL